MNDFFLEHRTMATRVEFGGIFSKMLSLLVTFEADATKLFWYDRVYDTVEYVCHVFGHVRRIPARDVLGEVQLLLK